MDELARFYRTGLIESIILLVLVLLAFGGITILARDRWLALGITESLLARLAAAVLIGAVAVGGMSGVVLNLLQGPAFTSVSCSPAGQLAGCSFQISNTMTFHGFIGWETIQ